ncbi:unnamed protein product [Rangifer tarandus platyrhynchus]|uniref:Uncharacterized protein n=1 Tax=Rangifer tarandus platyrhynchus TaxID=3082113 RepID=A0AC59Z0K1_RANTA
MAETCVFAGFTQMSALRPELQKMHGKQQVFASYSQWTPLCVCTRLWTCLWSPLLAPTCLGEAENLGFSPAPLAPSPSAMMASPPNQCVRPKPQHGSREKAPAGTPVTGFLRAVPGQRAAFGFGGA